MTTGPTRPLDGITLRATDVWQTAVMEGKRRRIAPDRITAEVSQSLSRAPWRFDGVCPTITPRGCPFIGAVMRPLSPLEKLLLQGFPIQHLDLSNLSGADISFLAGNSMHVACVGWALAVGMMCVKW